MKHKIYVFSTFHRQQKTVFYFSRVSAGTVLIEKTSKPPELQGLSSLSVSVRRAAGHGD